uniref:RNA uridylyltransferase n=1 Tax=Trypanosoma congolense (strain IL3000) TaxID=1068625 RepID=F9W9R3_TRYCI|nr:unnamed protein product [Trypanosoma congolense IL3000]
MVSKYRRLLQDQAREGDDEMQKGKQQLSSDREYNHGRYPAEKECTSRGVQDERRPRVTNREPGALKSHAEEGYPDPKRVKSIEHSRAAVSRDTLRGPRFQRNERIDDCVTNTRHDAHGRLNVMDHRPSRDDTVHTGGGDVRTVETDGGSDGDGNTDDDANYEEADGSPADDGVYGEDGATDGVHGSFRLYSCDACPHAVFSTHSALLAHAEEQHADLLPDHARLRRIARKLSPVWERALNARRCIITSWGRKIFDVAAQRDAGEEKMREAHRARAQLECVVRRWHDKARVFIFGSSVAMGVWDGIADIDFAVVDVDAMERGSWPPLEKNAVRSITELLRRAGFSFVNLEPISHARVPIIKHHASSPITTVVRREAEDVVSRSVRYVLNGPVTFEDRMLLEGSVRDAVGPTGVQQVWWNRTADMMSVTLESTTAAVQAAMCSPALVSPSLRAKVQPAHDECRPELYNIDFDLSFRAFGVRNSTLLRKYLLSHPCARPGAIVLKDWSKTSGVNNSVNGYFTSYAINIMWIYYLVQKNYVAYVDPLEIPESLVGYTDFDPIYTPMIDPQVTNAELEELYKEAGSMLVGFFYFYSFEFDWEHHVVSLNRPGVTTKKMLGWHVEDVVAANSPSPGGGSTAGTRRQPTRYELCIEDPYEDNLNLGRHIGITKSLRVRTELYRGLLSLLKEGESKSCVFASAGLAGPSSVPGRQSSAFPVRALFRLMALTTQAISRSSRLSQSSNEGSCCNGGSSFVETTATSLGGGGVAATAPSRGSSTPQPDTPLGVHERTLEGIFMEKAPLEFQLVRKVWNWHQLVHRLGYKIHRGYVMPRRELGVRCTARRDADEACGQGEKCGMSAQSTKSVCGLTDNMLRDLSRGYMKLTPEWVAWSAPWASQHLRGYSRLMPTSSPNAGSVTNTLSGPLAAPKPLGGEAAVGGIRTTRRNAAPACRAEVLKAWFRRILMQPGPLRVFR